MIVSVSALRALTNAYQIYQPIPYPRRKPDVVSLVAASLGGALFSGCPFRSAFSIAIRVILEILQTFSKRISGGVVASGHSPAIT